MTSDIQIFAFKGNQTRVVMVDGEPWFVAKDVATTLGYSEASMSNMGQLLGAVPDEWKGRKRITTRSENGVEQEREVLCLSEQGLYFFLGRSDKPAALPYQKTVAGKVMPSIRKYGVYMTPQKIEEVLFNPDLIIGLAQKLKDEQAKSSALEAKVEQDKPKVLFADSVSSSSTSILVGNLAKLICQNGVDIGQNRLFKWLREKGYLISRKDDRFNMPTQKALDMGLFDVKERTITNPDGSVRVTKTTMVTGKGQVYFVNLFLNKKDKVEAA